MTNNTDGLLGTLPETATDKLRNIQIQKVRQRMKNPASPCDAPEVDHRPAAERFGTEDPDELDELLWQEEKENRETREQEIRESLTDEEIALKDAIEFEKIFWLEPTLPKWLGPNWTLERYPREKNAECILGWIEEQILPVRWASNSSAVDQADRHELMVHITILVKALQELGVNHLPGLDKLPLDRPNDSTGRHEPWTYKPAKVLEVLEEVVEATEKHLEGTLVEADGPKHEKLRQAIEDSEISKEGNSELTQNKLVSSADEFCFYPLSDVAYFVSGFGEEGHVENTKGIRQIHRLLQSAGSPVNMQELSEIDKEKLQADPHSRQPVWDEQGKREIAERLAEEKRELAIAEDNCDTATADRCRSEITKIAKEVESVTYQGKDLDLNSLNDKFRKRIHGTLKTAYGKIRKNNPTLEKIVEYLENAISAEGNCYTYRPLHSPATEWNTISANSQAKSD